MARPFPFKGGVTLNNTPRIGVFPCKLWREASKELDLETLCILAYLWTCQHRKIEGLFELPLGYIASDLNIPVDVAEEKIKLLEDKGFVAYEDEVIFVKGYMGVQNKLQGKVPNDTIKGIINNLTELQPSKKLLELWVSDARNITQLWQGLTENSLKLEEVSPGLKSEYILSKYLINTEYLPSGSGSGNGSGSGGGMYKGSSVDDRSTASNPLTIQQHNKKYINALLEQGLISKDLAVRAQRFVPTTTLPLSKERWFVEINKLTYIPPDEYSHFDYNVELDELDQLIDQFFEIDFDSNDKSICLFNDDKVKQRLAYRVGIT